MPAAGFAGRADTPGRPGALSLPRCGHCKSLAPIYEELGKHFQGRSDVVIAKMDATANDVVDSRFSVKGFPTLYLKTAAGEVVPYSGDRSESDLTQFVESHAAKGGDEAVAPEPAPEPAKDEL
jgi:protein disulfide-isomerase A1